VLDPTDGEAIWKSVNTNVKVISRPRICNDTSRNKIADEDESWQDCVIVKAVPVTVCPARLIPVVVCSPPAMLAVIFAKMERRNDLCL
jgi:hypothetical protein